MSWYQRSYMLHIVKDRHNFIDYSKHRAVHFRQVGAYSWKLPLPTPLEPIPKPWHPLPPMRFLNGGSRFIRPDPKKAPCNYTFLHFKLCM
jgi:hypothetical protein